MALAALAAIGWVVFVIGVLEENSSVYGGSNWYETTAIAQGFLLAVPMIGLLLAAAVVLRIYGREPAAQTGESFPQDP